MTSASPANQLDELGQRTLRRARRRIMPLIVLLYFIAYLDRNNVGFAKLTMSEDIGLSASAYGLGAGMFFLGYALLEIPSNAGMYRFGARKWIARILISWGIFATAMCLVNGPTTFYIVRFLLGAAEAGFFPAILFYLTLWFPAAQRVTVLGISFSPSPFPTPLALRSPACCCSWTAFGACRGGSGCTSLKAYPGHADPGPDDGPPQPRALAGGR
jgi:ACS family tartrate transporter-like MFS transporter